MSADTVIVRKPTATPAGEIPAASFDLDRPIAGVHVGIRTDSAWRSWRLIASVWDEYLRRDGARTTLVETGGMVGNKGAGDRKHIAELADGVDCAIVGLGTCGSCTTFTIKDSVAVEEREKPVVAIVTEEFEVHGHNVAKHLGHGDLKVLVLPYPLEARPEAELRAIADEFYPQVLVQLGVASEGARA
jgi:methyl coenzyme M reductase subunit C-like uncharacterized protein (methanogenesis marker protein 7)